MRRRNEILERRRPGVTLLELVVAAAVSAAVVALAFIVFSGALRGFLLQRNLALGVGETIVAKKRIDRCLSDIVFVKECADRAVTCRKADADTFVTLRFVNGSLCMGNTAMCGNVRDFTFTYRQENRAGPWALLWNCRLGKGGWFGGAVSGRK